MAAVPAGNPTEAVERILSKTRDLAALPQVVFKILEMTGGDNSSATDLERSITIDPGFSAKLLAQANSASMALPKKVTSIKEAVMFMGFRGVRQLAMAVGVFDMFVGKTDRESVRRRSWWRMSLETASVARGFANDFSDLDADLAYTCGLLHYIGKTVLCRSGAEYEKVMLLAERGVDDRRAETAVFGCDHVSIGMAAATKWGLPSSIVTGMNYADEAEAGQEEARLRALVALSHSAAQAVQSKTPAEAWNPPAWAERLLGVTPADRERLLDSAAGVIAQSQSMQL